MNMTKNFARKFASPLAITEIFRPGKSSRLLTNKFKADAIEADVSGCLFATDIPA